MKICVPHPYITIILFFSTENFIAQNFSSDRQITFRLSNPLPSYSVYPNDSVFYAGEKHKITVKKYGRKKNIKLFMAGCKIVGTDSVYYLNANSARMSVLSIYEKKKSAQNRLVYSKSYTIKEIEEPFAMIAGVKGDSSIEKLQMIKENTIKVYWKHYRKWLKVVAFSIDVPTDTSFLTLSANDNKFDINMRRELFKMNDGDILNIHTIKVLLPNGDKKNISPISIYINETDKFRDKLILTK